MSRAANPVSHIVITRDESAGFDCRQRKWIGLIVSSVVPQRLKAGPKVERKR